MSPTRPSFIETYRKLVSYVTFPDSVTAMFPELTIRQKYVLYGVVVFCIVGEWLGILITNVANNSSNLTYYVTLSNSAIAPTCLYLMYQAIIEGHHTMVIDTVFALFSGTASTFYHFCDEEEDRLPYCEVYECVHCGNGTKYTNDFPEIDYYPEINRCCATIGSAEAYEKLQHLDFGSAYFLVCMTILMVAKISPVAVKVVVYLAVFKVCWEAMTYENRFGKGAGMVFLVACTCSLLIFIRITFIIRKFKEKNPEGGTKGALKNLYKACPLRWLALSQLLAFCGVYARFGMEDENTGLRKDYAVPHAFWHIGVMSATVFLSKFAVDFNANCKTSWMGGQGDESRDGTQMVKVEKGRSSSNVV